MSGPSLSILLVLLFVLLPYSITRAQAATEEKRVALLIIDVQNCFISGALTVPNGKDVIPVINKIRRNYGGSYKAVFITQDWHCPDHVSFASQYPDHAVNTKVNLTYDTARGVLCKESTTNSLSYAQDCTETDDTSKTTIEQNLWPEHCVRNTTDAQIDQTLITEKTDFIIRKGSQCQVDSYSAFNDNGKITKTELEEKLQNLTIYDVHIVGLATDFCVYYTAKDAFDALFETVVIQDATKGMSLDSTQAAINDMKRMGIKVINSTELSTLIPPSPSSASSSMTSYFTLLSALAVTTIGKFM